MMGGRAKGFVYYEKVGFSISQFSLSCSRTIDAFGSSLFTVSEMLFIPHRYIYTFRLKVFLFSHNGKIYVKSSQQYTNMVLVGGEKGDRHFHSRAKERGGKDFQIYRNTVENCLIPKRKKNNNEEKLPLFFDVCLYRFFLSFFFFFFQRHLGTK